MGECTRSDSLISIVLLILFLVVIFLLILLYFGDLSWPFCRRSCLPFNRRLTGHYLGKSSGSAVDAARRTGNSTPHPAGSQHATKCYLFRFRQKFGELGFRRKLI